MALRFVWLAQLMLDELEFGEGDGGDAVIKDDDDFDAELQAFQNAFGSGA